MKYTGAATGRVEEFKYQEYLHSLNTGILKSLSDAEVVIFRISGSGVFNDFQAC
jgi:hypothetical protein